MPTRSFGLAGGSVGKTVVAGVKDRRTNKVRANVVSGTSAQDLIPFVQENVPATGRPSIPTMRVPTGHCRKLGAAIRMAR